MTRPDVFPIYATEKNNRGNRFFLIVTLIALLGVFFFPRYQIGNTAKIRLEDVAFVFIGAVIFMRFCLGRFRFPLPVLLPFCFICYPFIVSLLRAVSYPGENLYFLVFWGKELSYLALFAAHDYFFRNRIYGPIIVTLVLLIALNTIAGLVFMTLHIKGYYGIGAMFLADSASLSGQVYLGCAIAACFVLRFRFVRSRHAVNTLRALCLIASVCCLATMSKSSSFGLIAFFAAFYVLNDFKERCDSRKLTALVIKWIFIVSLCICAVFLLIRLFDLRIANIIDLRRLYNPLQSTLARYAGDLLPKLDRLKSPVDILIGTGYLSGQSSEAIVGFTSAFDSQYIRNILVLGVTGSCLWAWLLLYYCRYFYARNREAWSFYTAMLISYLIMGVGLESFQLSKSGAIFWITLGMLTGLAGQANIEKAEQ